MLSLLACTTAKKAGGEVAGTVAEWIACPTDLIDCGHVYLCEAASDNPLGHVEICVDDDGDDGADRLDAVEAMYGACELTPRHQGLCRDCCAKEQGGEGCDKGCNAYNGCACFGGTP